MLSLDLHPIFRSNRDIDIAIRTFLLRAAATGESSVALIPGNGSGKLRQRVMVFLEQPHIKKLYRRVEPDRGNSGRILVHLRGRPGSGASKS